MICAICGTEEVSLSKAIDQGWVATAWELEVEIDGPFCPLCCEVLMESDEFGGYNIKKRFQGRIIYQAGNFIGDEWNEGDLNDIIFDHCDN